MAFCLPAQQLKEPELLDSVSSSDEELEEQTKLVEESFSFPNSATCWVCNGYYGSNFDEPLCGACHEFLYNTQRADELETTISDDDDSGNDEPPFKDKQEVDDDDDDQENSHLELVEEAHGDLIENVNLHNADNDVEKVDAALLAVQRPRPLAPCSLPQYMHLLSEVRGNATIETNDKNIVSLPVEIMVIIFSHLDDISMLRASEVCKQWHNMIAQNTSPLMWKKYLQERWPLFRSLVEVPNWLHLYGALMSSCFCRTCLLQMALKSPPCVHQNAIRMNFLRNDLRLMNSYASEGIEAIPLDKQKTYWQASILGPVGSPYEGGKFFLYIFFPERYPMIAPTVRFLTKILHPNVSRHGDVGIDIFQHNWSLALNVFKVLLSVQSLLTDPFTEVCMEPELGYMYETNRVRFENLARSWTWKYAMFELLSPH